MEKRLLSQIECAFAEAAKLLEPSKKLRSTTSHALLEFLGDAMNCKWGAFWLVDSRLGALIERKEWEAVNDQA